MPREKQYTPEQIEQKFEEYKQYCKGYTRENATPSGKVVRIKEQRVMTLGEFINDWLEVDNSTFENYRKSEGYEEYFRTVKKIDDYIFKQKKSALVNGEGNTTGLIFDLKANHGLVDKQTIDQKVSGSGITVTILDTSKEDE